MEVCEDGEHSLNARLVGGEAGLAVDKGHLALLLKVVEVYESIQGICRGHLEHTTHTALLR